MSDHFSLSSPGHTLIRGGVEWAEPGRGWRTCTFFFSHPDLLASERVCALLSAFLRYRSRLGSKCAGNQSVCTSGKERMKALCVSCQRRMMLPSLHVSTQHVLSVFLNSDRHRVINWTTMVADSEMHSSLAVWWYQDHALLHVDYIDFQRNWLMSQNDSIWVALCCIKCLRKWLLLMIFRPPAFPVFCSVSFSTQCFLLPCNPSSSPTAPSFSYTYFNHPASSHLQMFSKYSLTSPFTLFIKSFSIFFFFVLKAQRVNKSCSLCDW